MSTLGDRIRDARESKNLYQGQLAELIGVKSAAVISNWEKNINKPDADKIVRLCEALGISASYLLDYSGGDSFSLLPHEIEHIERYRNLDNYGKEAVNAILDIECRRCENSSSPSLADESQEISERVSRNLRAQKVD